MLKKFWLGAAPAKCDVCGKAITSVFIDGKWMGRAWANQCPTCFDQARGQLGLGSGQRYEKQDDGRWLKTGG